MYNHPESTPGIRRKYKGMKKNSQKPNIVRWWTVLSNGRPGLIINSVTKNLKMEQHCVHHLEKNTDNETKFIPMFKGLTRKIAEKGRDKSPLPITLNRAHGIYNGSLLLIPPSFGWSNDNPYPRNHWIDSTSPWDESPWNMCRGRFLFWSILGSSWSFNAEYQYHWNRSNPGEEQPYGLIASHCIKGPTRNGRTCYTANCSYTH